MYTHLVATLSEPALAASVNNRTMASSNSVVFPQDVGAVYWYIDNRKRIHPMYGATIEQKEVHKLSDLVIINT